MWLLRISVFLAALFAGISASPSQGNETSPGVQNYNWETPLGRIFRVASHTDINNLNDELQPGDVMVMEEGDWNDARITITASGSAQPGRKIFLEPEVFGRTRLTGKVQLNITGSYIEARGIWIDGISDDKITPVWFEKGSSHCRFTNSAITNFNRADHFKAHHWVEIFGSHHSIDYIALEGKLGDGQLVRVKTDNGDFKPPGAQPDSWGHHIAYNYFGAREEEPDDNGEGIQIGLMESENVDTDTTIEFNLFDEYDGEIECISVKATRNVVRYNTFESSACTLTLRHTDDTLVLENYFFCRGKYGCGGVRTYGSFHHVLNNYIEGDNYKATHRAGFVLYKGLTSTIYTREATDNMYEGNLLVDCTNCIVANINVSVGGDVNAQDNTFKDNIFVGKDDSANILRDFGQERAVFQNNVAWRGNIDRLNEYESGFDLRDPQLVYDADWGIYRPTASGLQFSMTHKPLTVDDVGPNWNVPGSRLAQKREARQRL